jgi:hypothetical protein
MAEPTDPNTGVPNPDVLEKIKTILNQIYTLGQNIVSKGTESKEVLGQLSSAGDILADKFKKSGDEAKNLFQKIADGTEDAAAAFREISKSNLGLELVTEEDAQRASTAISKGFKVIAAGIKTDVSTAAKFISSNKLNLAEKFVFDTVAAGLETNPITKKILEWEKEATSGISKLSPMIAGMRSSVKMDPGQSSFVSGLESAFTGTAVAAKEMGITVDDARAGLAQLGDQGLTVGEVFGQIGSSSSIAGKDISGLAVAMRLSASTGLSMGSVGNILRTNIRELGRSADEAGQIMAALSLAQDNTGLSMDEVSDAVMKGAQNLKFYGTSVEQLSDTFNSFVRAAGAGRQALGKELFQETIGQISQMNFGMKAYLGMQSSIGQGRGGIGAGLAFEQALEEGNTEEIFASIRQQLEEFGGGQVLTRKDAVDSGQETQYLMQRQLLQRITGQTDAGKLESMLGILKTNELERSQEVFAPKGLDTREAQLLDSGQKRIDMETGVVQGRINALRASEAEAIGKTISAYSLASAEFKASADEMIAGMKSVARGVIDPILAREGVVGEGEEGQANADRQVQFAKWAAANGIELPEPKMSDIAAAPKADPTRGDVEAAPKAQPSRQELSGVPRIAPTVGDVSGYQRLNPSRNEVGASNSPTLFEGALRLQYPAAQSPVPASPQMSQPTAPIPATAQSAPIQAAGQQTGGSAIPASPTATQQGAAGATAAQSQAMTFDVSPLEIPLVFKVEGDTVRVAFASMESRIIANINRQVVR